MRQIRVHRLHRFEMRKMNFFVVIGVVISGRETYNLLSFMNTYTVANKSLTSPAKVWRVVGLWALGIGVVLAAAVAWFLTTARSALPELDGTVSAPGLSAPVSVTRDGHGVPTIEAANLDDLFFAQGYVTAQDRLFQMDLMRRAAAGELSEVVGDLALKHDRQQRILGIRAAAEINLAQLGPEDRQQFEAYARGVNAYMAARREKLPIEFRLLHYSPRQWEIKDSMII